MGLLNSQSDVKSAGVARLPSQSHYFIGNQSKQWHSHIPHFSKVQYSEVYPGIDLVYYGSDGRLEYDFIIAPGADPSTIRLRFDAQPKNTDISPVRITRKGALILSSPGGELRFRKPYIYQKVDGQRRPISGGYVLEEPTAEQNGHIISFQLAAYDTSLPLIIDPVLAYSTYAGGTDDDFGRAITVDDAGNAYVTGYTLSTNFPLSLNPFQANLAGGAWDAFVMKLSTNGSLVYSTYLGGSGGGGDPSGSDTGNGIAVDTDGNVYIVGQTRSTDFPTTTGAFQETFNGGNGDAFVSKLGPDGSTLEYSTYLGSPDIDQAAGVVVDSAGNAYVTGDTFSSSFPTTLGAVQPSSGG